MLLRNISIVHPADVLGDSNIDVSVDLLYDGHCFVRYSSQEGEEEFEEEFDGTGYYLMPGWIDLQLNDLDGFAADEPTKEESVARLESVIRHQIETGTTSFLMATVASPLDRLGKYIEAASEVKQRHPLSFLGLLIEGTMMNPVCKGCHSEKYIFGPSVPVLEELLSHSVDAITVVNVAPELPNSIETIQECQKRGIMCSIGHSLTNGDQLNEAVEAGASYIVHLGNGHTGTSFKPHHGGGMMEASLRNDNLKCTVIADGVHISPEYVRDWLQTKGLANFIVVTDRAFPMEMPQGDFEVFGVVGHYDTHVGSGALITGARDEVVPGQPPVLFGSAATMNQCANNMLTWLTRDIRGNYHRHSALTEHQALSAIAAMCSRNPATLMKRPELGDIKMNEKCAALLVHIQQDESTAEIKLDRVFA